MLHALRYVFELNSNRNFLFTSLDPNHKPVHRP